ncbi:hypothetical protein GIY23_11595 [Allosaccharopolyspora coralli]|uniref:Uncharacterized protein n=1 Tax=Allosaccharopolyspora coralli TaxID=2665642 RepID=A0A5Q3Q6J0_9PSEU|nr:hypothetical protein [Allosaccharopolyspora coralli]QGK70082.1 hypothetical protein GIY23_11595 [Allosaccharopolyspora coralli]
MDGTRVASAWQHITGAAEIIAQEARSVEALEPQRSRHPETEELEAARDALLALTSASHRLARLLDALAVEYARPGPVPSASHVALDQAAAAAEDLGSCTRVAAHAIVDLD